MVGGGVASGQIESVPRLNPFLSNVRNNAAMFLAANPQGEAEAVALLEEGLRLEPQSAKLHNTFGILHAEHGRFTEARRHRERALEIEPRYEEARQNLQRLATMGR